MSNNVRPPKIALANVRVFDGQQIREPSTVIIDGGLIGVVDGLECAEVIDGQGGVLLPGLIDAHIHLHEEGNLKQLASYGVTTALDMGTWPLSLLNSLRARVGLTDIRGCSIPAAAPWSRHSQFPGWPKEELLSNPEDAQRFVTNRVTDSADYIKIIADVPGPDQSTLNAITAAARAHGKPTVAHASIGAAFHMAQEAKVDMITHSPIDETLDDTAVKRMRAENRVIIPTLTMMQGVIKNIKVPGTSYDHARNSVNALYHGGVPILAGTDANAAPGVPFNVPHGDSIHLELELLVDAGLSTVDALRAATVLPAKHFGLNDRGVIAPGYRADLVLIEGDPIKDIRATRSIKRVWCGGLEYTPVVSSSTNSA